MRRRTGARLRAARSAGAALRRGLAVATTLSLLTGCAIDRDAVVTAPAASPAPLSTASPTATPEVVPTSPAATATPSPSPTPHPDDEIRDLVARMSDDQLAGQLLVIAFSGTDATDVTSGAATANRARYGVATPAAIVDQLQPGGVILMGDNTVGRDGTSSGVPSLVAGLQAAADVPLLVAIDQEHGPVVRLDAPFTRLPAAMAVGATGDLGLARRTAAASGRELVAAGITVNLAPVADLNTEPRNPVIGIRSPGETATSAAAVVAAQVRGLQDDAGLAAAVKHFPGHGDTTLDSHRALPIVAGDLAGLRTTALVPFEAAVRAGVDLVMPGHLLLADIDAANPATLSSLLLQDVLRDELGFEGVVISDSMEMAAIQGDDPATAVAALLAGIDLVLMPPDAVATRDAVVAAMTDGTLPRDRVVASVERILRLKDRRGLLGPSGRAPVLPAAALLATNQDLATEVAARAVTVLDGACPGPLAGTTVAVTGHDAGALVDALEDAGVATAPDADRSVRLWDGRGAPPVDADAIIVVTGSPYRAGRIGEAATLLATYDDTPATWRGLAQALASGVVTGRSPVVIPRTDGAALPVGHGVRCTPDT